MTDLTEKVAKAICQGTPFDQHTALMQNVALAQARAAIKAVLDDLMEPTQGMRMTAQHVGDIHDTGLDWLVIAPEIWQAMLTAKRRELNLQDTD